MLSKLFTEKEDYTTLWNTLREKISLVKYEKECPGQGTFGHITGGYDAGYYGYVSPTNHGIEILTRPHYHRYTYSLVFAADMYATVFKADPLDPARGQRYRDKILRAGGSREELESLEVRRVTFIYSVSEADVCMCSMIGFLGSTTQ